MTITRHLHSLHPDIAVVAHRFPSYPDHVQLEHADKQSQTDVYRTATKLNLCLHYLLKPDLLRQDLSPAAVKCRPTDILAAAAAKPLP